MVGECVSISHVHPQQPQQGTGSCRNGDHTGLLEPHTKCMPGTVLHAESPLSRNSVSGLLEADLEQSVYKGLTE